MKIITNFFKTATDIVRSTIGQSTYISRDLSWLKFNVRVLDQAKNTNRTLFERLKFMAITSSNLDEFFSIRIGSLYNYLDYKKERIDYSGLRERPFRKKLLDEAHDFVNNQVSYFNYELLPYFERNGFNILKPTDLDEDTQKRVARFFMKTVYPMLTPMVYDAQHAFPILVNQVLTFGVVSIDNSLSKPRKRLSFVQIPQNLPRFYEIVSDNGVDFIPIEEIIRWKIDKLYRNVDILSANVFRITRNGDFTLEESDDIEVDFIKEIKNKVKTRKTGRVVRVEIEQGYSDWMMKILFSKWEIDKDNIFVINSILDYTCLWQIVNHSEFRGKIPPTPQPVSPLSVKNLNKDNIFEVLKERDVLLHHPYNNIEPVIMLLEKAAEDPKVLAIKQTIYRLASDSRITNALLKAVENGKHVSVLFEVKARFDEENNIREAEKLEKAGCFVIYGISRFKTHTKLLMIVRKEDDEVTRYVHLGSGNYNEKTSRLYTDISLLTTNEVFAHDVSEFFNVITGHSKPEIYQKLITAPRHMRKQLIELIRNEANNAKQGLPCGIVLKVNSLEDKATIDELYLASQAGVPIKLIVRGICCIRPGRKGLSENITVKSIVGDYLEHARLYYFHNNGLPKIYGGSADIMVRSFDKRIESLFMIDNEFLAQETINILDYNLKDNINSYLLQEDGSYIRAKQNDEPEFNIHKEFYKLKPENLTNINLF
jgi:polyphosphate kinase